MDRRTFIQTPVLALTLLAGQIPAARAASETTTAPAAATAMSAAKPTGSGFDPDKLFVGEKLTYHISFWWFDKAGSVSISFQRLSGGRGYLAQAGGQTHGIIGFVTRYRRDLYRTFMRYDSQAGLLLPYRFEEDVIVGREKDRAVRVFDYGQEIITLSKLRQSGRIETERFKMPDPYTVDYLSAYYNLRAGAYGKPVPGSFYRIPTMPNQGNDHIRVWFQDEQTTAKMRQKDEVSWPHLAKIIMDPKIIRSEQGRVDGWMDADLKPQLGVLRSVLFFGDIKGAIFKEERVPRVSEVEPTPLIAFEPGEKAFGH